MLSYYFGRDPLVIVNAFQRKWKHDTFWTHECRESSRELVHRFESYRRNEKKYVQNNW